VKRFLSDFAVILLISVLLGAPGCSNAGPGEGYSNCSNTYDADRDIQAAGSLSTAVENDDFETVETMLQDYPELINEIGSGGATPLHFACSNRMVDYLISKGAGIDARAFNGDTPLHSAVLRGNTEVVEALLQGGAPVSATSTSGQTPLHYAAQKGSCETVNLLVSHGADVNCRDTMDRTPLDVARAHCNDNVVDLLRSPGGT
jgi:ankyrin repeat protein